MEIKLKEKRRKKIEEIPSIIYIYTNEHPHFSFKFVMWIEKEN